MEGKGDLMGTHLYRDADGKPIATAAVKGRPLEGVTKGLLFGGGLAGKGT